MTGDRWNRIESVYHAALDRPPDERRAFIAAACQGDDTLRQEVEGLVSRHRSSGEHPLDRPVWKAAGDSSAGPAPGTRLGPYEILESIGAGGMGQVYRARDTRLDRTVAIKISLERFSDRFSREARAIAALNHPNICTLHDVGPDFLVMELVEGPTLAERLRKGPLPADEALAIARQIAAAVEAAHERGIVHRDLKPANIKVRSDGSVKVFDFGLARSGVQAQAQASILATVEMTGPATGPGVILGTPGYMSPEQAMGKEVDKRADIWAFGTIFYEMLAGGRLFGGESAQEAMGAVMTREPDFDRVPAEFRKLLRSCLEKDPKLRLRDIGDAWRLVDGATEADAPPGRSSRAAIAVAAVLAVIAAGALTAWWRAPRTGDRPLLRLSLDLGANAMGGDNADLAISPDSRRIAFVVRGQDGKPALATRLLDQSKSTVLAGTEGAHQPFFSPDGQWIGYFTHGSLNKISIQGGAPVAVSTTADMDTGGSWQADDIATALGPASSISLIPAAGGPAVRLTKLNWNEKTHRWPQLLPGGNILFTASDSISGLEGAGTAIADRKTGVHTVVLRGGFHARYVPGGYLLYAHQGALFATRFDLDRQKAVGSPVPLVEDLAADSLIGNAHFQFAVTPEGSSSLVYLAGKMTSREWAVTFLDPSGRTQPLIPPGEYFNPAYSPDGRRIALVSGVDIFVYDLSRGVMTRLTSDGTSDRPVWTPDGGRIAFGSRSSPPGLWWVRGDGGAAPESLLPSDRPVVPWSFSPDGRRLAYFQIDPQTGYDLWTLPIDTSDPAHPKPGKPELFLRTQFNEACPAFSPDGHWIAYASGETGPNEIYVRPASGEGKWQISTGGGMFAAWSPTGSQLYFEGPDNRIQVVDYVAKGGSFEAGKPRPWSERQLQPVLKSNFTVAPNGKGIAIFEAPNDDGKPPRVGVLLNFLDELKRRLP
jgi:Tol biopolymer transport system component/tRNA A-37 threonylcarbamoyl transferase component Bud32